MLFRLSVLFFSLSALLLAACQSEPAVNAPLPDPTNTAVSPTSRPSPTAVATARPTPSPAPAAADADVLFVRATETAAGTWTFHVTVAHPDTGWEDYADGWDVVLPDGTVVKPDPDSPFTRLLLHPHETEQPFTRSQSGIVIPPGTAEVYVRAHDLVDGFGGQEVVLDWQAAGETAVATDFYEIIPAGAP